MTTSCYWCVSKLATIANPVGEAGVPLGSCSKCGVLCCGHHAQRDPYLLEYLCLNCDGVLLRASAFKMAEELKETQLSAELRIYDGTFESWENTFDSYTDFQSRRPGYNGWFSEIESLVPADIINAKYRDQLFGADDDVRLLTIAAVYFKVKTQRNLTSDYHSELLRVIAEHFINSSLMKRGEINMCRNPF